jgi:hypothetical protein
MDIIQSFYYSSNNVRQKEIDYTLFRNLNKVFVNKIHLFIEDSDFNLFITSDFNTHINYKKINLVKYKGQPKYPDLFRYCSDLKNTICCICNSDIEFNIENKDTLLLQQLYNNKSIYFLTRHEYNMSCPLITNFCGSHDAFIFHSDTLKTEIELKDLNYINYIQNTNGIEALLTIFFIEQLNYKILNPCFQIQLIHHHKSNVRLWEKDSKCVGYTYPRPLKNKLNIHNKYMIKPCNLHI